MTQLQVILRERVRMVYTVVLQDFKTAWLWCCTLPYYFHLELLESKGVLSGDMLLNKRAMSVDCGTIKLSVIDIDDNEDAR